MAFIDALLSNDKKGVFKSDDTFVNYSTGLIALDYANGFWLPVKQENGEIEHVAITGIIGGTFTTIIGTTGSGKTTLADYIGWNIVKPFADGLMIHVDAEQTALKPRICAVTGADPDDPRLILTKDDTSIEFVLTLINKIAEMKEAGGKQYMYEVKNKTYGGKPFMAYVPTVIIIDSLPQFNSINMNVEDLGTNMDGARGAKDVAGFYNKALMLTRKYNISIFPINHLVPKVEADRFAAPPQGLIMIRPGENVPRGMKPLYMSQNVFRCNAIKSNMYDKEKIGFEGFKIVIQIAKSKTAFIGSNIPVAFNAKHGFDPVFSLFEYGTETKIIQNSGAYYYLQGMEDMKFTRKNFREKYITDDSFREKFNRTILPYFEDILGNKEISDDDRILYEKMNLIIEDEHGNAIANTETVTKKGNVK